jgi:hypothetical protein
MAACAHEFAVRHAGLLRRRLLWLFSSDPIGEPPPHLMSPTTPAR